MLLEFSKNPKIRAKCINLLNDLRVKSKQVYNKLESAMISDESVEVRNQAVMCAHHLYPERTLIPISWVITQEKSIRNLFRIIKFFELQNKPPSKIIKESIKKRLESDYEVRFRDACFLFELDYLLAKHGKNTVYGVNKKKNRVVSLNLAGLGLDSIPTSIGNLTKLKYLNLWNNRLEILPWTMEYLKELDSLYLNYNNFKKLPDFLDKLTSLKKLSLSNNFSLNSIPQSLISLVKSNFSQKYQDEGVISDEAPVLGLLEVLTGQKLKKLEKDESVSKTCAINYKLNSDGNVIGIYIYGYYGFQINFIPQQLQWLNELEEIVIRDQNIKAIPTSLVKLKFLKLLDLMGNSIKAVPNWLLTHPSLEKLDLSENQLVTGKTLTNHRRIEIWI